MMYISTGTILDNKLNGFILKTSPCQERVHTREQEPGFKENTTLETRTAASFSPKLFIDPSQIFLVHMLL